MEKSWSCLKAAPSRNHNSKLGLRSKDRAHKSRRWSGGGDGGGAGPSAPSTARVSRPGHSGNPVKTVRVDAILPLFSWPFINLRRLF